MTALIGDRDALSAIDQYYRAIHGAQRCSEEEERKYLERVARGVAERSKPVPNQWVLSLARDARDYLVERYQPMVEHWARRSCRRFSHFDMMDLVQEGNIGLLKAIETFASVESYCFAAFASVMIRDVLRDAFYAGESVVAGSASFKCLMVKLRRFESDFFQTYGCDPDVQDIADGLALTYENVLELLRARNVERSRSLQEVMLYENGDEGKEDFTPFYVQTVTHENERQKQLRAVLDTALDASLTTGQKAVLSLRFDLIEDQPRVQTYKELGEVLGIDHTAAHHCCKKALAHLRSVLNVQREKNTPCYGLVQADAYTVSQAAALLEVDVMTVRRFISAGLLPAVREKVPFVGEIFLLPKQPVEAFLAARRQGQMVADERHEYYTTAEAASLLGLTKTSINRYASSGRLPGKKTRERSVEKWMVSKEAVHALLADRQSSSNAA